MGLDSSKIRGVLGQLEPMYLCGIYSLESVREDYQGHTVVLLSESGASDNSLLNMNEMEDVTEVLRGTLAGFDLSLRAAHRCFIYPPAQRHTG